MRHANHQKSRTELWGKGGIYNPSPHLAQFGMTLKRFETLVSNLAFVSLATEQEKIKRRQAIIDEEEDEMVVEDVDDLQELHLHEDRPPIVPSLWSMQQLFDDFNMARENFHPGPGLCIDESTIEWNGKDSRHTDGCPVVHKNPNKPVAVHLEKKGICCGTTGVMLRVLPSGNKYDIIKDEFSNYQAHTACTLRLARPFKSSNRTVYADSWFGSVQCATALRQKLGLWSVMVIKRNSKGFPKQFMNDLFQSIEEAKPPGSSMRGQSKFLTSAYTLDKEREPVPIFATGWKDHRLLKYISTAGTSLPGQPRKLRLWKNNATKSVPFTRHVRRPKLVEDYSKCAGKQDEHNQFRQGTLRLEKVLSTHRWEVRTFVSLFGMSVTDAYLSYRHFGSHRGDKPFGFERFVQEISKWLIEGDEDDDPSEGLSGDQDCTDTRFCFKGSLMDLSRPQFIPPLQKRCQWEGCKKKTRTFCARCTPHSPTHRNEIASFCMDHWSQHLANKFAE